MKILITGGLGFIGSHLATKLKNHEITIFDNFGFNYPGYNKIYRGPKVVIDSISKLERYHRKLNINYRMNLVKESKEVKDEATAKAMDEESKNILYTKVKDAANNGKIIFWSSHDLEERELLKCTHALDLENI